MPTQTGSYDFTSNDTSYTQFSNSVKAGTSGVKRYTLLMRDSETTWSSFVNQANSTATTKTVVADGFILSKLIYSAGNAEYAADESTSTVYDAYPFDFRYSTNCGSTLTNNAPVYLVGTIHDDNLFYFDTTTWYTQTIPSTPDDNTYIYVGNAYSTYQVWLATENPAYQFYNGQFMTIEDINVLKSQDNINNRIDEEIAEVNENITNSVSNLSNALDQDEILRRLTDNFNYDGMYLEDGNIYIKANYIKSNTLSLGGADNNYGTLMIMDENNEPIGAWDKDGIRTDWFNFQSGSQSAYIGRGDTEGVRNVYIDNDSIDIRNGQDVLASFGEITRIGREFGTSGEAMAHLDMSGDKLSFKVGNNEVAYISVDPDTQESIFYMTKAIVVQDLYFGNWQWRSRSNGNLALKWIGTIGNTGDTGSTGE